MSCVFPVVPVVVVVLDVEVVSVVSYVAVVVVEAVYDVVYEVEWWTHLHQLSSYTKTEHTGSSLLVWTAPENWPSFPQPTPS